MRRYSDLQGAVASACVLTAQSPFAKNADDMEGIIGCGNHLLGPFFSVIERVVSPRELQLSRLLLSLSRSQKAPLGFGEGSIL